MMSHRELTALEALFGKVSASSDTLTLQDWLRAVYHLLGNSYTFVDAYLVFSELVQDDGGLTRDLFEIALRKVAKQMYAASNSEPEDEEVLLNRLLEELSTVGIIFMPDVDLEQLMKADSIVVLQSYDNAIKEIYSSFTSPVVGVKMPWVEVAQSNTSLNKDRFLSCMGSLSIYPDLLPKEALTKLFYSVRHDNQPSCKRWSLDQEHILFSQFQELLCRCALVAPGTASSISDSSKRVSRVGLLSQKTTRSLLPANVTTASLSERLVNMLVKCGLRSSTVAAVEQPAIDSPLADDADDPFSKSSTLNSSSSSSAFGSSIGRGLSMSTSVGGDSSLASLTRSTTWVPDTSDAASRRVAAQLQKFDLAAAANTWSRRQVGPAASALGASARTRPKRAPEMRTVKDLLRSTRPNANGKRRVPQPLPLHMDITGPKPSIIKELLCVPPCPAAVACQLEAGLAYHNESEFERAVVAFNTGRSIWEKCTNGALTTEAKLFHLHAVGAVYESQGDDEQALAFFMDAKTVAEALPPNHSDVALSYSNVGGISYEWGHYPMALRCYEQAMEIKEKSLGLQHPDTAAVWNNMGCCLDCLKRTEEARHRFQLALSVIEARLSPQHPRTQLVRKNLARMRAKPMEMHLGVAPLSSVFRPDKDKFIPGGRFFIQAFEPSAGGGGGKKKKKGGKKKKKK